MRVPSRYVLAAWAAVATVACSNPPSKVDPLTIPTGGALADAYVGSEYGELGVQLAAAGGTAPYHWALSDKPALLSWLDLDGNGKLIGVPTAVTASLNFTVTVTDAMNVTASRVVSLAVKLCKDGDRIVCVVADPAQCLQNTVLCSNGTFPGCAIAGSTPSTDPAQCGAATPGTSGGACGACDPVTADSCAGTCRCGGSAACSGSVCCAGSCVDAQTDVTNCGTCGTLCTATGIPANSHPVCATGACGWACDDGFTKCGDACVNLQNDAANCSACGHACTGASALCSGGVCYASCPTGSGLTPCGSSCVDMNTDPANCGACGTSCSAPANGTTSCASAQCQWACSTGFTLCGGTCENLLTSMSNCGACGKTCTTTALHAHATCWSGYCDYVCNTGYKDCDGVCIPSTQTCVINPCLAPAQYNALVAGGASAASLLPVCP